jgi:hypothetical protein
MNIDSYLKRLSERCGSTPDPLLDPLMKLMGQNPPEFAILKKIKKVRGEMKKVEEDEEEQEIEEFVIPKERTVLIAKYEDILKELEKAVTNSVYQRVHLSQGFEAHLHTGAENELVHTVIVRKDNVLGTMLDVISYGNVIAKTQAQSNIDDIPFMQLEVEGAGSGDNHSGQAGLIEVVGAPFTLDCSRNLAANEAVNIFLEVLRTKISKILPKRVGTGKNKQTDEEYVKAHKSHFVPLSGVLKEYNQRLKKGKHTSRLLRDFELVEEKKERYVWYVGRTEGEKIHTQVNFEMPLRCIIKDEFVDLFTYMPRKQLYEKCRLYAGQLVNANFIGLDTVGNARFQALFTLYYFHCFVKFIVHWKEKINGKPLEAHESKNEYELLCKVGPNDIIRCGLNPAEKEALFQKIKTAKDLFFLAMTNHLVSIYENIGLLEIKGPARMGKGGLTEEGIKHHIRHVGPKYHQAVFGLQDGTGRYYGESDNGYGKRLNAMCKKISTENTKCRRPLGHKGDCGTPKEAEGCFVGTGKPLPVQQHYLLVDREKGLFDKHAYLIEPVVVFESRIGTSELAKLGFQKLDLKKKNSEDEESIKGVSKEFKKFQGIKKI